MDIKIIYSVKVLSVKIIVVVDSKEIPACIKFLSIILATDFYTEKMLFWAFQM